MEEDSNQTPPNQEEESRVDSQDPSLAQKDTVNEQASTREAEVNHYDEQTLQESSVASSEKKSSSSEDKKINFDFEKSLNETKGILKDAILKPHTLIKSNRTISLETSAIIFVLLAVLIGIVAYFSYRSLMENLFGGFGGLFGAEVGIDFMFKTMLAWLITFAVGYFSLYFMLQFFGNRKMEHKLLLTKYAIVNIPFALVFCLVFILFGFLMVEFFIVMYVFGLMLFGMIHVYLFLVNVDKPKFDLFWLISGYLLVLIVLTYLIAGIEIPGL